MNAKLLVPPLLVTVCLLVGGCNYDFALTAQPTRKVDDRLLGDWTAVDKEGGKPEMMKVRKLDASTYIIVYNGDLYRAFHSDFAKTPFVSVQDLDSGEGKYVYFVWRLSADGATLGLRSVNTDIIPQKTKDQAAAQSLIKKNLTNPALLNEELPFVRPKPAKP
jgi:hypothetical protein